MNDIESSMYNSKAVELTMQDVEPLDVYNAPISKRSCVICSIDASMDPEHVRLQNEAFAKFGEDLFGYNFLKENQAVTVIHTVKIQAQIADTPAKPAPTADKYALLCIKQ